MQREHASGYAESPLGPRCKNAVETRFHQRRECPCNADIDDERRQKSERVLRNGQGGRGGDRLSVVARDAA